MHAYAKAHIAMYLRTQSWYDVIVQVATYVHEIQMVNYIQYFYIITVFSRASSYSCILGFLIRFLACTKSGQALVKPMYF